MYKNINSNSARFDAFRCQKDDSVYSLLLHGLPFGQLELIYVNTVYP